MRVVPEGPSFVASERFLSPELQLIFPIYTARRRNLLREKRRPASGPSTFKVCFGLEGVLSTRGRAKYHTYKNEKGEKNERNRKKCFFSS